MPAFRRLAPSFFIPAFAVMALSTLAGCDESNQSFFAPACPALEMPGVASDRFVYDGRGLDVGSLVSHTQITSLSGNCERGPDGPHKQSMVRTRLSLAMNITRGPAEKDGSIDIPYFVAVMRDGKIVDKKIFTDTFQLAPNVSTQQIRTDLRIIDLPQSSNPQANPYTLEVGYQLTRDELQYNRQHLPTVSFHSHSE